MKRISSIVLPSQIGDGRLDTVLKAIALVCANQRALQLNWTRVQRISPAGNAVLACLSDLANEHGCQLRHVFVKKKLKQRQVVRNILARPRSGLLPPPQIHNDRAESFLLAGNTTSIDLGFMEKVQETFANILSEDRLFACRLLINELMQNSVDHSTSERYYLYAGAGDGEFHVGVLDLGITIPAKLEQKYHCENDVEYLNLALKAGVGTRRQRPGGLGLWHVFDLLRQSHGKLTILSRRAQLRRYFNRRSVHRSALKHSLPGTWCFARFPLEKKR